MQVINLYTKELKPKILFLSFNTLILAVIALIILFIVLTIFSHKATNRQHELVENIERLQFNKEKKLMLLGASIDTSSDDSENELKKIDSKVEDKNDIISSLKYIDNKLDYSFFLILSEMGKKITSNLYISSIVIKDGAKKIQIQGVSRDLKSITQYLHHLKKSKSLESDGFYLIEASKNENGNYDFFVGNKSDP